MLIRRLEPGDAAAYQQIRRRALDDVPAYVGPSAEQEASADLPTLRARMANYESEGIYVFGCFIDDQCAGVTAFTRKLNPRFAHKVFLWGLYILPAFRGKSIGRKLVERQLELARTLPGVRFVTLQVTTTNKPAIALYGSFGFVRWGIEPKGMLLDGEFHDFESMQLDLYPDA